MADVPTVEAAADRQALDVVRVAVVGGRLGGRDRCRSGGARLRGALAEEGDRDAEGEQRGVLKFMIGS